MSDRTFDSVHVTLVALLDPVSPVPALPVVQSVQVPAHRVAADCNGWQTAAATGNGYLYSGGNPNADTCDKQHPILCCN